MADFGIGETIALSAALGAGSAAMKNQDPLRGALIGGVLGGATAGAGSLMGGAATVGDTAAQQMATTELGNVTPQVAEQTIGKEATNQILTNGGADGISQFVPPPTPPSEGIDSLSQVTGPTTFERSLDNTVNPPLQNDSTGKGFFNQSTKTMLGDAPLSPFMKMAAPAVATTLTPMFNTSVNKYGVPPVEHYTGPLSQLHYDPSKYVPTIPNPPNPPYQVNYAGYAGYKGYAEGGIAQLAEGGSTDHVYHPSYDGYAGSNQVEQPMPQQASGAYPMGDIPVPTRTPVDSAQQFNPMLIPNNPAYIAEQNRIANEQNQGFNAFNRPFGLGNRIGNLSSNNSASEGYAAGGITQLQHFATGGAAPLIGTPAQNTTINSSVGNNTMFPMSEMARSYYATPTNLPAGINNQNNNQPASPDGSMPGYGPRLDSTTGQMQNNFAEGGIAGLLKGRGDGMSDDIHATINDKQPARLADGEFVIPADVVSHLGNGSTDAGAKHLYAMMDKVRKARTGRKSQGKQISAGGYLPA